jgi:solute carrier family 45 protein 1/2/4
MEHPPAIPGDEDPTTQVPWPTGRGSQQPESPVAYREPLPALPAVSDEDAPTTSNGKAKKKRKGKKAHATADGAQPRMSVWNLVALSVSMGGAVIMWTMELGYVFYAYHTSY